MVNLSLWSSWNHRFTCLSLFWLVWIIKILTFDLKIRPKMSKRTCSLSHPRTSIRLSRFLHPSHPSMPHCLLRILIPRLLWNRCSHSRLYFYFSSSTVHSNYLPPGNQRLNFCQNGQLRRRITRCRFYSIRNWDFYQRC